MKRIFILIVMAVSLLSCGGSSSKTQVMADVKSDYYLCRTWKVLPPYADASAMDESGYRPAVYCGANYFCKCE